VDEQLSKKTYPSAYVAFLDILGFKAFVRCHTHKHLESFILDTFYGTAEHALSNGKYVSVTDGKSESIGPDIRQATVNSLLISDNIWLWTNDDSAESFAKIVKAVRSLLAFSMIDGIALRGAISIGPLTLFLNQWPSQTHSFQHTLFGRAIVDAVQAEEGQAWCGCVITKDAIEYYKNNCSAGQSLIDEGMIVFYPVPINGKEIDNYVIDWVNHPQAGIDTETVKSAFAPPFNSQVQLEPQEWEKIKSKLMNTLKFVKHVKPSADQDSAHAIWP
jgi:hypothetical protein